MILYIDTTNNKEVILQLRSGKKTVAEIIEPAERSQAEKLLPAIERMLTEQKMVLQELTSIEVNNHGGSYTSLRIGVVTANALAFALDIPIKGQTRSDLKKTNSVSIIEPVYDTDPQIVIKKPRLE